MLIEATIPFDSVEVLADGTIQVREATVILRDSVRDEGFPPRYRRYVLEPGADLAGMDERVTAIAASVWAPDIVAAAKAKRAAAAEALLPGPSNRP